jgi:hypothetical protein
MILGAADGLNFEQYLSTSGRFRLLYGLCRWPLLGGCLPKFWRTLPRSGRQPSFSTDTLGIFYERRFNAEASSIQLKSVGIEMALVAVITHTKGGLQTKPLKLRIDLTNTCAKFHWFGLSPVLN